MINTDGFSSVGPGLGGVLRGTVGFLVANPQLLTLRIWNLGKPLSHTGFSPPKLIFLTQSIQCLLQKADPPRSIVCVAYFVHHCLRKLKTQLKTNETSENMIQHGNCKWSSDFLQGPRILHTTDYCKQLVILARLGDVAN